MVGFSKPSFQEAMDQSIKEKKPFNLSGPGYDSRTELQKMMEQRPEFESIRDEKGNLKEGFELKKAPSGMAGLRKDLGAIGDVGLTQVGVGSRFSKGTGVLDKLQQRAFGTVDPATGERVLEQSPYEARLLEQQGQQEAVSRERALASGGAQTANIMARLGAGGAGAGAAERAATSGERAGMLAAQGVAQQGMQARTGIGLAEEGRRQSLQERLPGMELAYSQYESGLGERGAARQADVDRANAMMQMQKAGMISGLGEREGARGMQADQFNIMQRLQDVRGEGAQDLSAWQEGMASYGAGKTADAQLAAAKEAANRKSGLFGGNIIPGLL